MINYLYRGELKMRDKKNNVISVQYHPESAAGPEDSEYIFNRFMELMKKCGGNDYAKTNRY